MSLTCDCAAGPVEADLTRAAGAWRADVDLPKAGVWRASLIVGGARSLGAGGAAGVQRRRPRSPGLRDQLDRRPVGRRRPPLPLLPARPRPGPRLASTPRAGSTGARSWSGRSDDAGDPARARHAGRGRAAPDLAVPCGTDGGGARPGSWAGMPVHRGRRPGADRGRGAGFRLSGDPYAEGWAVGPTVARTGFVGRPELPEGASVVVEADDPGRDRTVAGLRAGLALDPALAAEAEGNRSSPNTADVEVIVLTPRARHPADPDRARGGELDRFTARSWPPNPVALAAPSTPLRRRDRVEHRHRGRRPRAFDEHFVRSSKIGRRGDVMVYGEVAPDSGESLFYTKLVHVDLPGERPPSTGSGASWPARRSWPPSTRAVDRQPCQAPKARPAEVDVPFGPQDGLVSGWSPAVAGGGIVALLPVQGQLHPGRAAPAGAPSRAGTSPRAAPGAGSSPGNVGLCGPQLRVDGPPPECNRPTEELRAWQNARPPGGWSARFDDLVQAAEQVVGLLLREAGDLDPPGERAEVQHRGARPTPRRPGWPTACPDWLWRSRRGWRSRLCRARPGAPAPWTGSRPTEAERTSLASTIGLPSSRHSSPLPSVVLGSTSSFFGAFSDRAAGSAASTGRSSRRPPSSEPPSSLHAVPTLPHSPIASRVTDGVAAGGRSSSHEYPRCWRAQG